MHTYNGNDVAVIIGGLEMSGFGDDDFVSIENESDDWSDSVGVDGEVTRSKQNDRRATVTITVKNSSPVNTLLDGMRKADLLTGLATVSILIKDLRGDATYFCRQAWIMRAPDTTFSRDAGDREWAFRCAELDRLDGGIIPNLT